MHLPAHDNEREVRASNVNVHFEASFVTVGLRAARSYRYTSLGRAKLQPATCAAASDGKRFTHSCAPLPSRA